MTELNKIQRLCLLALFIAITVIMAFTPLGFIPLPFMKATILHIPAIIGAVLLGPKAGALLGMVFGTCSVIKATLNPGIVSFAYSPFINLPGSDKGSWCALIIAYLPRICMGIFIELIFKALAKTHLSVKLSCFICGAVGALINSVLSLGCVYVFLAEPYSQALHVETEKFAMVLGGIFITNSIPEAIIAAILVGAVCSAVIRYRSGKASN